MSYAGQTWKKGLVSGLTALPGLQIVVQDLRAAARLQGIFEVSAIELWESDDSKGFFVGDTSGLPDQGWTKLAVL